MNKSHEKLSEESKNNASNTENKIIIQDSRTKLSDIK